MSFNSVNSEEIFQENSTEYSITASHLLEFLYCPRFTYFQYVLDIPQHEEKRFKVGAGREAHERVRKINPDYFRKKIGVAEKRSDVYLSNEAGLRGIVDEILFLNDGTAAPLDYKYAEYKDRVFKTYKVQLVYYARLIKDNYHVPVNTGFLVYTRSKNKLIEVEIGENDFKELDNIIKDFLNVIQRCRYPGPTKYRKKCPDCCYRNICEKNI